MIGQNDRKVCASFSYSYSHARYPISSELFFGVMVALDHALHLRRNGRFEFVLLLYWSGILQDEIGG